MKKGLKIQLVLCGLLLFLTENAWALYGQPTAVDIVDSAMAIVMVLLTIFIFVKVKFKSSLCFRISLGLVIFNLLVWIVAHSYRFYIDKTVEGWAALGPLGIAGGILSILWLCLIPISIFIICLISNQAKRTILVFLGLIIMFCGVELGLNYKEINNYLSAVEESNYQDFKHTVDIRNYLSASGFTTLRLYPKKRTRKVLLAFLKSPDWYDRLEGALSLQYLRDLTTIPYLKECLRIEDKSDKRDRARKECAVSLEMLTTGDYDLSVYKKIIEDYDKNSEALFKRLGK